MGFVSGDDVLEKFKSALTAGIAHLDGDNTGDFLPAETRAFLESPGEFNIISAHAYLGARGVKRALDLGCDVVICESHLSRTTMNPSMTDNIMEVAESLMRAP